MDMSLTWALTKLAKEATTLMQALTKLVEKKIDDG